MYIYPFFGGIYRADFFNQSTPIIGPKKNEFPDLGAILLVIAPYPGHIYLHICPEFAAEDEKMPRLRGYIVGYSTRRHRIYNIYPFYK